MIKIGFGVTSEEAWSDYNRCNNEDVFIEQRSLTNFLELLPTTVENLEVLRAFTNKVANGLLEKQQNEIWIIGLGYVEKSKVTIWLRLKGYMKKLLTFRIHNIKQNSYGEDVPF